MNAVQLTSRTQNREQVSSLLSTTSTATRPVCRDYDILVKVKAASVTVEDLMYATGSHHYALVSLAATEGNPVILGQEFSGVVEEVGVKVLNLQVGDEVLGHKPAIRVRHGCWAEYVVVHNSKLLVKPSSYSFAEAAALPLSGLVAYSAVKAAGFNRLPRVDKLGKEVTKMEEIGFDTDTDNQALLLKKGGNSEDAKGATVALVGASTTIGLIVLDMLTSRRIKVVAICSKKSAPAVLARGAVAVLDRSRNGGLGERGALTFSKIIDCVGGEEVESMCRETLGVRGHLISIVRPGMGLFGDDSRGAVSSLTALSGTAARSVKSLFSQLKYSLATAPVLGQRNILAELVREEVKPVIDCEVDMSDETKVRDAIDRVVQHKSVGTIVFVNN